MSRIVMTGAVGFVGSYVISHLLAYGYHVTELVNRLGADKLIYMSSAPVIGSPIHIPVKEDIRYNRRRYIISQN